MVVKRETIEKMEPIEAGMHSAVCYGLIDLGLQLNSYNDKLQRKVLLIWETDSIGTNSENKEYNRSLSKDFVLSLHEKSTLCKTLESWRGRKFTNEELTGFDLRNILDKPCFLNVQHTEKEDRVFANIASVVPLAKNMPALKRTNEIIYFDMEEGTKEENLAQLEKLPKYIQERIKKSTTYQKLIGKTLSELQPIDTDDLPF